jgi:hypothetical protein
VRARRGFAFRIVTVALAVVVSGGPAAPTDSGQDSQAAIANPSASGSDLLTPASIAAENGPCTASHPSWDASAAGANPCKSCPKSLAPGCARVSCDPCCFQCPGEPFLRCL